MSADEALEECVRSLEQQTYRNIEVIVIDNSGTGRVRQRSVPWRGVQVIENPRNVGFGCAINQAFRASNAPYLATLNDDATACPRWLETLVAVMEEEPAVGMCASKVLLAGQDRIDSAGMLICGDGSSKQRGHGRAPNEYRIAGEVLLPSGSAALYRRSMLDKIGLFDDDFFLYCEDTDLGLRARWAGWGCRYVPEAEVEHRYSHSAGKVSALKAYYVERNRLFVAVKSFPAGALLRAPFAAVARYFWHAWLARAGEGVAGRYIEKGGAWHLAWLVVRAHIAMFGHLPVLWSQRQQIRRSAHISPREFTTLLQQYAISPREVAAQ